MRPEWMTTQEPAAGEDGSLSKPLVPKNLPDGYTEYAIGDPRRRPRWGVPLRLDIRQLVAVDLKVWILDFILLDSHKTGDYNVTFGSVSYSELSPSAQRCIGAMPVSAKSMFGLALMPKWATELDPAIA